MQVIANHDGGIEEAIGGFGVDQRLNGDWRLAQNEEVDQKRKVTRGGKGEGEGCRPARLLLAGVGVFWLVSGSGSGGGGGGSRSCGGGGGGIRVWEKIPGSWKGPLGGGITG